MKNFIKVVAGCVLGVLSIVSLSSCSKMEQAEMKIVGKWQSTSYTYKGYEAGKLVDEYSQTCVDWYRGFNFKSDNTGQEIDYEEGSSDTWPITWVIMGDKLMVTEAMDEETETYDIISISGDSMTLEQSDEWTAVNGLRYKEIETFYFKKIK